MEDNELSMNRRNPPRSRDGGARLRAAREAAGSSSNEVAAETRILTGISSRSRPTILRRCHRALMRSASPDYARAVGLDEQEIISQVREQLASGDGGERMAPAKFEPGDPARVPGRGLAWFGLIAALLLVGGIFAFYRSYLAPGLGPAPLQDETEQVAAAMPSPTATPTHPAQRTGGLHQRHGGHLGALLRWQRARRCTKGSWTKATVSPCRRTPGPQIWTGRVYALAITVGGRSVPKISEVDEVVKRRSCRCGIAAQRSAAPAADPATAATPPRDLTFAFAREGKSPFTGLDSFGG